MVREKYVKYDQYVRPPDPEKKKGFARVKEVIENFFYHHKFMVAMIIVGTIFVVFVLEPFSDKTKPDMEICLVTTAIWYHDFDEEIEALMTMYCEDYNGDGKIKVQIKKHLFLTKVYEGIPLEQQEAYNNAIWAEVAAGQKFVYICDKGAMQYLGYSMEAFCNLDDNFSTIDWELDESEIPFESFAFDWTQLRAVPASTNLKDLQLYIAMRDIFTLGHNNEEKYDLARDFLKGVLADRPVNERAYLDWLKKGGTGKPNPLTSG